MSTTVPSADSAVPVSPGLQAERDHLAAARDALRRMREDVEDSELVLGDVVNDKVTNAALRRGRARRLAALADVPGAPLFFGRLDFEPGTVFLDDGPDAPAPASAPNGPGAPAPAPAPGDEPDRVHIGRRHVHDPDGRPMVLDWRAPVCVAYYRASPSDRMGVRTRRRYGFTTLDRGPHAEPEAVLTAFEDEPLTVTPAEADQRAGELLSAEIERPRTGPMRDIVATIQPEQDDLVRAPLSTTLCVQGAPGTGKTAVGLHRVAYLLYTERARLSRSGVAIVGPNRSFLSYIRDVLPALGEVDVRQTTVTGMLTAGLPERARPAAGWVRRTEEPAAARIKGRARMAEVLRRDLWSRLRTPEEPVVVRRGSRRWRLYPEDLRPLLDELAGRGVAYGSGRELLSHRIAHAVLSLMESQGEACDDRTHEQVRRDPAVRSAVTAMWPKADPLKLVLGLLTDPDRLARAAEGLLSPEEQAAVLLPGRPRGPKSARWSEEDLALVDEAAALIERPAGLGHIVVDEAQDLSPMQCRAVGRRCVSGSLTVLGDIAQGTSPSATTDWSTLLEHLGKPTGHLSVLNRGYRVPAQIIDFAARLLPSIAPVARRSRTGDAGSGHPFAPVSVRRAAGSLRVTPAVDGLAASVVDACRAALGGEGSVGLVAADTDLPALREALEAGGLPTPLLGEADTGPDAGRLVAVPASLAKGLEFDAVVVAEPAAIVEAEERGANRLYVVLTRAVSTLHVVHVRPLPEALRDA
ncbi:MULTISPECIES: HelD family protein [Nocardiopsis]|uniref:AAA family ATPase n=1 Tax=Nocardiopsis sinuspersici TaxID=501010 RepID=A0A1V3C4U7_9ACTN|nr:MULTISPECIES: AAA family ATPase [Nocardiopsis]OOC55662.1 AAA family ATPase [Nocardiopsis sinuspersici]